MAILVNESTVAIVQGITGEQGRFHTRKMLEAGTKIVGGVTPGKHGQEVHGVPVYDSVEEAMEYQPKANASIAFVPAKFIKDAAFEAIEHRLSLIVLPSEGVPTHDAMYIATYARENGINVIGPDTPGVFSPGKCKLGVHPDRFFKEGSIGVLARGGGISYEVSGLISNIGLGVSTCVNVGGHKITGVSFAEILRMFEKDEQTRAVALLGEVGGTIEEEAAATVKEEVGKPVVALIIGRTSPPGKRMGHAGAIIEMGTGTYEGKKRALEDAGVMVARNAVEVAHLLLRAVGQK